MEISQLRVNHLENPLGYDLTHPVFSFVVTGSAGRRLSTVRIRVATDEAMRQICYDSGAREDISALAFTPDATFPGGRRYYWDVTAAADDGDAATSVPAWFEGGMERETWDTPFITSPWPEEEPPVFLRRFAVREKTLARARLYICGLGLYEAYVNGVKAGDEYLAPHYNDYRFSYQYQTLDVTPLLHAGQNELRVLIGAGWYMGRFVFENALSHLCGDQFLLTARLELTYQDGEQESVQTDEAWKCLPSPVRESSIYDGEVYDARFEDAAQERAAFALRARAPRAPLVPRFSPPLRLHEAFQPRLIITPAGEQVLDFGQEISGWVEFDCDAAAGVRVRLQYGEILQDGCFYRDNLRTAKAEHTFISGGRAVHVRPHFTFYGFRYVKVTGLELTAENLASFGFAARALYSDLKRTGTIVTSDPKLNRLIENTLWGQKGNFVDVPTDCPQRDERLGWTGDAQVFCATASYHLYTPAFYRKYLRDMRASQRMSGGSVPFVVPDFVAIAREKRGLPAPELGIETWGETGSCAWGDAATVIPATLYTFYGDRTLLEETYENMKRWTDYIVMMDETRCGGERLWRCGFHFADWLALDNPDPHSSFGRTDPYYVASVYYLYSALLTARAARILGKTEDAAHYESIADEVRAAIRNEYVTPSGRVAVDTQTALVLAIEFDLLAPEHRARAARDLHAMLQRQNMHLNTGFVGTAYLCHALTKAGLSEDAYTLLFNEDYPSWLYEVNMGATTVWERWNSVLPNGSISSTGMNSLNHYAYGAVAEWIYRDVCGLAPAPDSAGFARIEYVPHPDKRLEWIQASYDSASGLYQSEWRWEGDRVLARLTVPFGCTAEIGVPEGFTLADVDGKPAKARDILESGCHTVVFVPVEG